PPLWTRRSVVRRPRVAGALPSVPTRRSSDLGGRHRHPGAGVDGAADRLQRVGRARGRARPDRRRPPAEGREAGARTGDRGGTTRSEEHTSELQSRENLVCRLLLEKKKQPPYL